MSWRRLAAPPREMESQHVGFASHCRDKLYPVSWTWECGEHFTLRPFPPEPTRCYRCHAFGHTIYRCRQAQKMRYMQRPSRHPIVSRNSKKRNNHIVLPQLRQSSPRMEPQIEERRRHVLQGIKVNRWLEKHSEAPQEPSHGRSSSPRPAQSTLPTSSRSFLPYLLPRSRHDK
ncbi:hypothetical protein GWK47_052326 [Chionoecetes opilio]|uniref:Uncharacterized protein n=1 Tax=Chionoecetes opilio TaxID=41210 RepID=A0A8J4Y1J8_CHIOP|nr:hypothetical protein GWK47_052326 [Chionoecetes opilio]